jgi:hypothetical protein
MGGCTSTPELASLCKHIKRRGASVQKQWDCICAGPMGTAVFSMDAGRSADHPDDVLGRGCQFKSGCQ